MKKLLLVVFAILALGSIALWARPFSVKCQYDGEDMMFDHQVGYGDDAVCWYSHIHNEPLQPSVKHQAYVPCNE